MLLQKGGSGTLPPPGFTTPRWEEFRQQWEETPAPTTDAVVVGPAVITMGHDDSEGMDIALKDDVKGHTFGWDNESPARQVEVKGFKAEWRPVSNGEFEAFLRGPGKGLASVPVSWTEVDGQYMVGPHPSLGCDSLIAL